MATAQQNVQNAVKRAVTDVREGDFKDFQKSMGVAARQASKVVEYEFSRVRRAATDAADSVGRSAREHPVAAAGILLGTGAIIGAAIYAAARPSPTALQLMLRGLRRTRSAFVEGWRAARHAAEL
jgi:hypothetical protein